MLNLPLPPPLQPHDFQHPPQILRPLERRCDDADHGDWHGWVSFAEERSCQDGRLPAVGKDQSRRPDGVIRPVGVSVLDLGCGREIHGVLMRLVIRGQLAEVIVHKENVVDDISLADVLHCGLPSPCGWLVRPLVAVPHR